MIKKFEGWDKAIADTERQIDRLKTAIKVFRENRERGEPWPGSVDTLLTCFERPQYGCRAGKCLNGRD